MRIPFLSRSKEVTVEPLIKKHKEEDYLATANDRKSLLSYMERDFHPNRFKTVSEVVQALPPGIQVMATEYHNNMSAIPWQGVTIGKIIGIREDQYNGIVIGIKSILGNIVDLKIDPKAYGINTLYVTQPAEGTLSLNHIEGSPERGKILDVKPRITHF